MPHRDWRLRIEDILESVEAIACYIQGMTFDVFKADRRTVDAVVRNFEIIGEAARSLPAAQRLRFPEIPWDLMADMRNVLIHEYFGVDVAILWKAAQSDLPPLAPLLRRILEEDGRTSS